MTLTEQLQAEQRERAAALNEATRRQVDPNRFRTDADRARLAATDAARLAAEETLNAARLAKIAAENAVDDLRQADGRSLVWRHLEPHRMTPAAQEYLARIRDAAEAIETGREVLQKAIRAHNVAVREVDANAGARRRQAKREGKL